MKNPKISVIMAVYNEEKYIREAIESILNQTFKDFEFIIVDDGSTDRTLEILKKYAKKDSRIKILRNEKNLGLTKSLNKALKVAKGEYIARIDAGDLCDPKRLEKQANFLDKNSDVYIVGCYHHWINEKGKIINSYKFPTSPEKIRNHIFGFGSIAAHPCLMIRKKLFDDLGFYDESFSTSMEYELYMRTISNGFKISNIPEFLVSVMRREKGISISKNKRIFQNMYRIRLRYLRKMFSIKNLFYTIISFLLSLMPGFLLRKIICSKLWSKKIRNVLIS